MARRTTAVSLEAEPDYVKALGVVAKRRGQKEGRRLTVGRLVREACDKAYPELSDVIKEVASFFAPVSSE